MPDDGGAREACMVVVSAGGYQLGGYGAYLLHRLRWLLAFRCALEAGYVTNERIGS